MPDPIKAAVLLVVLAGIALALWRAWHACQPPEESTHDLIRRMQREIEDRRR